MDNAPPAPETLKTRSADAPLAPAPAQQTVSPLTDKLKRRVYRPSHRATFIGLGAVVVILLVNAIVLGVVLRKQARNEDLFNKGQVSISTADLNRLGINRDIIGDTGVELLVAPDAQFKGKVSVAGTTTLAGEVVFNNKLTGTNATISDLQAAKTTFNELNVNGQGTLSGLNLRENLVVTGRTNLQGPVTMNQLLTVNNSLSVSGNLSVGGALNVNTFSVQNLSIGGHLITKGSAPNVGPGGGALGSNGTVSISGNDAAGTIAINIGIGASSGTLANVAFRTQYSNIPRVVITAVGVGANFYIINLTAAGFSVAVTSGLPAGGYKINYIVMQ